MHKIFKAKFFRKKSLFVEKPRKILNMFILFEYHQNLSQKIRILAKVCVEKHTQFNAVLPARAAENNATSAFFETMILKKVASPRAKRSPCGNFRPSHQHSNNLFKHFSINTERRLPRESHGRVEKGIKKLFKTHHSLPSNTQFCITTHYLLQQKSKSFDLLFPSPF